MHVRLESVDERAIRVAIALLEYALIEVAQIAPPRASTHPKYPGSALARGAIRVPLDDQTIRELEARIRARLLEMEPTAAPPAATGQTGLLAATGKTTRLRKR